MAYLQGANLGVCRLADSGKEVHHQEQLEALIEDGHVACVLWRPPPPERLSSEWMRPSTSPRRSFPVTKDAVGQQLRQESLARWHRCRRPG